MFLLVAAMVTVATLRVRQDIAFHANQNEQVYTATTSAIVDVNVYLLKQHDLEVQTLERENAKLLQERQMMKSALIKLAADNAKILQENEELSDYIQDKLGKVKL